MSSNNTAVTHSWKPVVLDSHLTSNCCSVWIFLTCLWIECIRTSSLPYASRDWSFLSVEICSFSFFSCGPDIELRPIVPRLFPVFGIWHESFTTKRCQTLAKRTQTRCLFPFSYWLALFFLRPAPPRVSVSLHPRPSSLPDNWGRSHRPLAVSMTAPLSILSVTILARPNVDAAN